MNAACAGGRIVEEIFVDMRPLGDKLIIYNFNQLTIIRLQHAHRAWTEPSALHHA
jgi:hypothetical protein